MRISTKGRYAIKLMLDLATNDNGEPIRLKDVARRQEISEKYLEQIISVLNKAGICEECQRTTGRLFTATQTRGVHRGHDPQTYRGLPVTGRLCSTGWSRL